MFALWFAMRVITTCSAMVLMMSMAERASALDCLAYRPEKAQGQWHADVVAGKICWYGPNWRSFLPKPKARAESSHVTNRKPVTQLVNREPVQVDKSSDSVKADNGKTDAQVENGKPEISTDSKPLPTEAVDRKKAEELSGLREATPAEAAVFTNAVSLKFTPALTKNSEGAEVTPQSNILGLFIALTVVVLGTAALVMLILKHGRRPEYFEPDLEEAACEQVPVDVEFTPPLQPNSDDEHQFVSSNFPEFLKREQVED